MRYGALTPEDLIDKLATKNGQDQIVITTCPCCNKEFYVLKSELYLQNDFRSQDEEYKLIDGVCKVDYPKCPHCGFAGSLNNYITDLRGK